MALTQIKTDAISDDAVTLAKQAAGTDGQIITYDASGNPTAVGPGTDGQVLTSTGAGSPPAFEDAAAGETNRMPLSGGTFTGDVIFDNQSNAGRDITWDESDDALEFGDNTKAAFGAGTDIQIFHDGTVNRFLLDGETYFNNKANTECFIITKTNGAVELYHNGGKKLETTADGITVTGDIFCGTNGKGISFESSNNNGVGGDSTRFDDYEEGTWTPGYGGWTSVSYDSRSGIYTKIGQMVYAIAHINTASGSSNNSGGHVYISGLPFTVANENTEGVGIIAAGNGVQSSTSAPVPVIQCHANTTSAYFYHSNGSNYSDSHMSNSDQYIRVTFIYKTAS